MTGTGQHLLRVPQQVTAHRVHDAPTGICTLDAQVRGPCQCGVVADHRAHQMRPRRPIRPRRIPVRQHDHHVRGRAGRVRRVDPDAHIRTAAAHQLHIGHRPHRLRRRRFRIARENPYPLPRYTACPQYTATSPIAADRSPADMDPDVSITIDTVIDGPRIAGATIPGRLRRDGRA